VFDIGFTELLVCLVVALVVIGPERLPETVRTIALWIGRLKRSLRETRTEIERQIGADDIRRQLYNEEILRNIEKNRQALENSIQEIAKELGPEAEARLKNRIYEHEELPDHAHMNEAPPALPDATTDAASTTSTTTANDKATP